MFRYVCICICLLGVSMIAVNCTSESESTPEPAPEPEPEAVTGPKLPDEQLVQALDENCMIDEEGLLDVDELKSGIAKDLNNAKALENAINDCHAQATTQLLNNKITKTESIISILRCVQNTEVSKEYNAEFAESKYATQPSVPANCTAVSLKRKSKKISKLEA